MAEKNINPVAFHCPKCTRVMQPMKTKNKYKCSACKIRVEQLTIFTIDKAP